MKRFVCACSLALTAAAHAQLDLSNYSLALTVDLAPILIEASAITYNWENGRLYIIPDNFNTLAECTLSGSIISQMTMTGFEDTEGLTYIGSGQFVLAEERQQRLYRFAYSPGGTLVRSVLPGASLGTPGGNDGIEGVCFEPATGVYFAVKEKTPPRAMRATVNFVAQTATGVDLFDPAILGVLDLADLAVLSHIPSLIGTDDQDNLLVLSQASASVLEVSRTGVIRSQLNLSGISATAEGITIDPQRNIYICDETPRLYVFKPCYANCDGSTIAPRLNSNDFACFLNRFAADDPIANCDSSSTAPLLNSLDFSCFLAKFAAGCP